MSIARSTQTKSIGELIGNSPEETRSHFESCDSRDTRREILPAVAVVAIAVAFFIRVPTHQRFFVWQSSHQVHLIDSVMENFPLPMFVFTQKDENGRTVWDVQDGQQRLTTLQKFVLGEFAWRGKYYNDLTMSQKMRFLNYQVSCSVTVNPTDNQIADIFERLNSGKALTDNDKFWNRRYGPIVSFILDELIVHTELSENFKKFFGNIAKGKSRSQLSDISGAVIAIVNTASECISTSFDKNGPYVCDVMNQQDKERVIQWFKTYFQILQSSMAENFIQRPTKQYCKLANMFGIYLYHKLNADCSPVIPGESEEDRNQRNNETWKWFAAKIHTKNWKNLFFISLQPGEQRNTDQHALRARAEYLLNFFANGVQPEETESQIIEDIEDSDNEEESQED